MASAGRAILAIDEGTSGTRAGLVAPDGSVSCVNHAALTLKSPRHGVVEQDADAILASTVEVCLRTIAEAAAKGIEIAAVALATQRATSVLWDTRTGRALVPAMVWQDSRHAAELKDLSIRWDYRLIASTGRPTGMRSPFLWAARHIEATPEVRAAWKARSLGFGTIDTWLLWHLSEARRCVTTPSNAAPTGGFALAQNDYLRDWLDALHFPADLLPQVVQEADDFGFSRRDVLGIRVPIRASCGDQAGGIVGLGCLEAGQALCVHGTGSFFHLLTGTSPAAVPGLYEATVTTPTWRRHGLTSFAVETFVAATGSALNWMASDMRWFESGEEISALAASVAGTEGLAFLPALTGLRLPVLAPDCRASVTGLSMAHGRAHLARAVLEGIAHAVVSCAEASARSAAMPVTEVLAGGGLSASDVLLGLQADLGGTPVRRMAGAEHATLRGAAFLAGSDGLFWDGLRETRATLPEGETFMPSIGDDERQQRRARWLAIAEQEIERAASQAASEGKQDA